MKKQITDNALKNASGYKVTDKSIALLYLNHRYENGKIVFFHRKNLFEKTERNLHALTCKRWA